ncbi:MAG: hypothetical protein WEB09_00580 [Nitriliruptor sp.]
MHTERFPFSVRSPWSRLLPAVFRDAPQAVVECNEIGLSASFGPFLITTPWRNVRDVAVSGPYRWFRVIGPRLSLADRGLTFGTSTDAGACIRFHEPVAALFGSRRVHPGLTVTVEDPHGLAAAIEARIGDGDR